MAVITAHLEAGMRVRVRSGRHEWLSDEPLDVGGTDAGPSPYELLLGGLAACTAITLRLYAHHKGIEISAVRLEYTYDRDVIVDGETEPELITSRVTITGDFTEAQRKRLAQIAERCPVHRTLERGLRVIDEVAFDGDGA